MSEEIIVKSFESKVNGGTTIVLDSVAQVTLAGRSYSEGIIAKYEGIDPKVKFKVKRQDPRTGQGKSAVMNNATFVKEWRTHLVRFDEVALRVTQASPAQRKAINDMAERIVEDVLELHPHISQKFDGFERAEEGFTAAPELIAMGDDRPCFRRRRGGEPKAGAGDGAYRVIINTDVPWWGHPNDNAAVMGALVILLQRYGPVEVWIQQGWLGSGGECNGVTLFKLDFTGSFEPTQLAFWCGDPNKDDVYSHDVNKGLGRTSTAVSKEAEIPCDLYLHGVWMRLHGVGGENKWALMGPAQQRTTMAAWLAKQIQEITYPEEAQEVT